MYILLTFADRTFNPSLLVLSTLYLQREISSYTLENNHIGITKIIFILTSKLHQTNLSFPSNPLKQVTNPLEGFLIHQYIYVSHDFHHLDANNG